MASNSTVDIPDEISSAQLTIIRTFTILTAILGTTGNTLTIVAIVKGNLYKTASFVFILNLSICNWLHCLIFHPLLTIQSYQGIWTNNAVLCSAYSYLLFSNLGAELWGYVCITLNRYFCIVHHHLYSNIYGPTRNLVLQLVLSWLFYHILFLLPVTGAWGQFEYEPEKLICHPFKGYNCSGFCLFTYIVAMVTTVPVIFYCYFAIIRTYVKSQKKIGLSREKSRGPNSDDDYKRANYDKKRSLSELKMAFTILAVILVFLTFRLPFMILYLVDPSMSKAGPLVHTVVIFIGSNSNWINPIIYAFTNKLIFDSIKKFAFSWKSTLTIQEDDKVIK